MKNQLIPVSFHGDDLALIDHEGEPYVAMKPIVEGMGLDWKAQHRRLCSDRFSATMADMTIVAADGRKREMACFPLRKLPGWLMTINVSRVSPLVKDKIIAYQNECDDVLWSYWSEGFAVNKRAAGQDFAQGAFKEFQVTRLELVQTVADMTESGIRVANLMGLEGNQGRFYADKVVKRQIGVGPMELLGLKSLPGVDQANIITYTPTMLGKRFGVSGQAFNKLLEGQKLQYAVPAGQGPLRWQPTEKGKPHSEIRDTGREHNSGGPVLELRWRESVLDALRQGAKELNALLHVVKRG